MSSWNYLFSLVTLGLGVYGMVVWFRVRKTGKIPANSILLPKGRSLDDCIDVEVYLDYMMPRLLIFSILIFLFGVFSVADTLLDLIGQWTAGMSDLWQGLVIQLLTCMLPMGIVLWFALCVHKIQRELW